MIRCAMVAERLAGRVAPAGEIGALALASDVPNEAAVRASVAAFNASGGGVSYASSKAGVIALTRSAAPAYGAPGLRANALAPGLVDTPMSRREIADRRRRRRARVPRRPSGTPDAGGPQLTFKLGGYRRRCGYAQPLETISRPLRSLCPSYWGCQRSTPPRRI
ncbi:MAG: SDR family oxidoreductase [Burkholderiales bacterium]|nr:SDR family oxidoreductase [Burkholderiales bacterium]MDE1927140.1 SDR family oxidoreductase [Burkholderiales bacterium]MDE2505285.1 SDR family oxidoreductase [Burkholderiales bacterium]